MCFHFAPYGAWLGRKKNSGLCVPESESYPPMAENRNLSDACLDDTRHSGFSADALAAKTSRLERNDCSDSSIKMVVQRIGDVLISLAYRYPGRQAKCTKQEGVSR